MVNETYLRKAGDQARFKTGEAIEIDDQYYLTSWRLIRRLVDELTDAAVEKLKES